jgi:hypothetical protein
MRIITTLLLLISLGSCSQYYAEIHEEARIKRFIEQFSNHQLYYGDFSEIETPSDIDEWIWERFTYVEGPLIEPELALSLGYGDCDTFSLLFLNILKVRFDIEYDITLLQISERVYHATISSNSTLYDAYNYPLQMVSDEYLTVKFNNIFIRN